MIKLSVTRSPFIKSVIKSGCQPVLPMANTRVPLQKAVFREFAAPICESLSSTLAKYILLCKSLTPKPDARCAIFGVPSRIPQFQIRPLPAGAKKTQKLIIDDAYIPKTFISLDSSLTVQCVEYSGFSSEDSCTVCTRHFSNVKVTDDSCHIDN